MQLLSGVMGSYSWASFKPILYSPEQLRAWILEKLQPEAETRPLHPDDPTAGELATLSAETEQEALEFWRELNAEEQTMFEEAFRELWGPKGAAPLPMSVR